MLYPPIIDAREENRKTNSEYLPVSIWQSPIALDHAQLTWHSEAEHDVSIVFFTIEIIDH